MQQTETYKLNKPGIDDPLAIAPLNENMDKLEAAIIAESETRQDETAALDLRVSAMEIHKIAIGGYYGEEVNGKTVNLGFTPKFVLIGGADDHVCGLITEKYPCQEDVRGAVCGKIVENGFLLSGGRPLAGGGYRYNYVAFA